QVKLPHPIGGVRHEEFAHRPALLAIEVDRLAPLIRMAISKVILRELLQIVPIRTEVVIDHIEDHAQPQFVRLVDESPKIVGPSVDSRRRKKISPIVPPPKTARKIRHWHYLQHCDPEFSQRRQLLSRGLPGPRWRKRSDVHLINHLPFAPHAAPFAIRPAKR